MSVQLKTSCFLITHGRVMCRRIFQIEVLVSLQDMSKDVVSEGSHISASLWLVTL